MNWLCLLGIHKYTKWTINNSLFESQERFCTKCNMKQIREV